MVTDFNNSKDLWSTGNRLKDYGIGAAVGLSNIYNKPGQYYVQSNWKGGGLANTGLGYVQNQNYQNPYDLANLLTSAFYNNKKGNTTLQDKLGIKSNLPKIDFSLPYNIDYSLPTKDYEYDTSWLYNTPRETIIGEQGPYSLGQSYSIPQTLGFLNR